MDVCGLSNLVVGCWSTCLLCIVFRLMREGSGLCWYDLAPRLRITNTLHSSLKLTQPHGRQQQRQTLESLFDNVCLGIVLDDGEIEYRTGVKPFASVRPIRCLHLVLPSWGSGLLGIHRLRLTPPIRIHQHRTSSKLIAKRPEHNRPRSGDTGRRKLASDIHRQW